MKKLMLLGGIRYLLPVIKAAHKQGYYVITADYLPDNIAHKYSDEYVNVSIIDKDAVLREAQRLKIDGVMSFGVDPGVVSAAYVAEKMGLSFQCSYEAACILQDKSRFRQFMQENDFNCPKAKGYSIIDDAILDIDFFTWPVIVKPVDSAGSKGVTKVSCPDDFMKACQYAKNESHGGVFIVEEYLMADGSSSGSESFFVDGVLKYNAFYDQTFDLNAPNPFVPATECWPSEKPKEVLSEVRKELQRMGNLLGFHSGLFNVEWRLSGGKMYLMEVSPRAGGNRLAEILNYATDINIIDAEIRQILGLSCEHVHEPKYKGCFAIYNMHPDKEGTFKELYIDSSFEHTYVVEKEIRVNVGYKVEPFTGANNSLGTLFLHTDTRTEMNFLLKNIGQYVKINLQ